MSGFHDMPPTLLNLEKFEPFSVVILRNLSKKQTTCI